MNIVKVELLKDANVISETLERIGIANIGLKTLWPSCYLYTENEEHFIVHFKELFLLTKENSYNNVSEKDIERRNAVIWNLKNWGLINVDESLIEPHSEKVFVLQHKEKREWKIEHKIKYR